MNDPRDRAPEALDDATWCERALRSEPLLEDVRAMVARALEAAARREQRRHLALGALALGVAATSAALAGPPVVGLAALVLEGVRWLVGLDRAVSLAVPGAWNTVLAGALALLALTSAGVARLLPAAHGAAERAVAVLAALVVLGAAAGPARALELEGDWPADERVTARFAGEPATDALRQLLRAQGLGLVTSWNDARPVDVDVQDAPLREVVRAIVGAKADVVVRRSEGVVTVEPAAPAAPPEPAPPPAVDLADAPDRVTFGDDVRVGPGERVRDVVTLGGDVEIAGHARDVITLGGDLRVQSTGVIHGDVVTAGGDVVVDDGGRILQGNVSFGRGSSRTAERPWRRHVHDAGHWRWDDAGLQVVGRVFRAAAQCALLFLIGLVLVGVAPERVRVVQAAIVRSPARAGALGVGLMVAGVAVMVVLFVTILGIPLAIALLLALAVLGYGGAALTASVLGAALPIASLRDRPVAQLGAGVAILFALSLVPFVDVLVMSGAVAVGLGALLVTRLGVRDGVPRPRGP